MLEEAYMKKSVMITGASAGSGFAISRKFASEGYDVFITSRCKEDARKSATLISDEFGVKSFGYVLDPQNMDQIHEVFQDIRQKGYLISTLILNAADLGLNMDVFSTSVEDFGKVIHTNIVWNFFIAREAALQMKEAGGGSIVFVGSNVASRCIPNRSAYIASKGGLASLSKALALELGTYGIRSNTLVMGSIKTVRYEALSTEEQEQKRKRVPIGDIADFEDMGNAAWFLGTALSKNITGSELVIDGGVSIKLF